MNPIVWLASYPKSGNTWFRIFLTNYLLDGDKPIDINNFSLELSDLIITSARSMFDDTLGINSSECSHDQIDALRPDVYRNIARTATKTCYIKAHDAYTYLPDGSPLFPTDVSQSAIYLVRHPLDVCVSFAHHRGHTSFNTTASNMCDRNFSLCDDVDSPTNQLRQKLLSWEEHVESWLNAPIPTHLIRYEDLHQHPFETFSKAIRFLKLPYDPQRIEKAIRFSQFDQLKQNETEKGFREKPKKSTAFFREGKINTWENYLSKEQINIMTKDHKNSMKKLGYLDIDITDMASCLS